ncbi:type II toxin-antitoxin system TacA family antitoxin [Sandaracinobacteroides saxicola]|uniref:DUF1778 domain-containing protein n=1 Tax=Sandaracinobacteroides saxicola TaxID=2759707 RepID=A0A7G5IH74_9SPHN|nr:DUF1778 domain-containing protein [Sandaracinobacteroides saxicola]QMW22716.1 DUF1778 domain-containing protein [Sandaracinobacteroides saxicola]
MAQVDTHRDHPLSLRLPQRDIAIIDRAARLRGSSRTDFMREAAVRSAEALIMESTLLRMSSEAFADFVAKLESEAVVVPELVSRLARKAPWEDE